MYKKEKKKIKKRRKEEKKGKQANSFFYFFNALDRPTIIKKLKLFFNREKVRTEKS